MSYNNAVNFKTKRINGLSFRVNNVKYHDTITTTKISEKKETPQVKDFKLLSLKKLKSEYSDEEDSDRGVNVSIDEDDYSDTDSQISATDNFLALTHKDSSVSVKSNSSSVVNTNQQPQYTHFIGIPLNTKNFIEKFEFFKNTILEEEFKDISENLFQNENRLHFTICLLNLNSDKEIKEVKNSLLESQKEFDKILQGEDLFVDFDKFEIFGSESKSRVLYTKPSTTGSSTEKLKDIIDSIIAILLEKKIVTKEFLEKSNIDYNQEMDRYELKHLHVSLINYSMNTTKDVNVKTYFNGQRVIKHMKNFSFGTQKLDEVALFEMKINQNNHKYFDLLTLKIK